MHFSHAPEIWQQFPQLMPGLLAIDGIRLQPCGRPQGTQGTSFIEKNSYLNRFIL